VDVPITFLGGIFMFSFFSSKNQKLVKQWKKEHKEMVALATKIVDSYTKGNHGGAKKSLKKLMGIASGHLMEEDYEINSLMKDRKRSNPEIESEVAKFKKSFVGTKKVIIDFLWEYSQPNTILDETFINKFNELVAALAQRIDFEENNLYVELESN